MKKLTMLFVAAALLAGSAVKAQNIDEIVKKHNDAVGGVEAWKKVNSIKFTGSMNAQGQEIPMSISMLNGKGFRFDMEMMGTKGYSIITPTAGWKFFPFGGGETKPEPMTADEIKESLDELNIMDEIMSYKDKGAKLEYLGKDDVEGTECFKLKHTNKEAHVTTLYVDPTSYQVIRKVQKTTANGQEGEETTNQSNFQKLPEGIVVPMSIQAMGGEFKVSKVEVNTIKDESIFKPDAGKGG